MSENSNTTPSAMPAGWYPHPAGESMPGFEMYWDGAEWRTDMVRQVATTDAIAAAPGKRPWYTRKAVIIPTAVVAGLIVIGGIGNAMRGGSASSDAAPVAPVGSTQETVATAEPEPIMVVVPNVVGMDGAAARAALEVLGIRVSADGDESMPVIAQDVAEGSEIEEGSTITLTLEEKPQLTLGQQNAIGSAESYLSWRGFSRAGLFNQLTSEYGEGFEAADAEFALAYLEQNGLVDWNEEAAQSAESYLSWKSFSRQGLYDQLTSPYGEQFTPEQAEYALAAVGY